jgi:WD40 repeat protein
MGVALDESGAIAAISGNDGVVRVGPATGEPPHLLFGDDEAVETVAIDPTGRWVATGSRDGTIRLWPMPDLSKPPFHTLPYDEILAKLRALTNLRVVADEGSPTGYKVEPGPFPGWAEVPTW